MYKTYLFISDVARLLGLFDRQRHVVFRTPPSAR